MASPVAPFPLANNYLSSIRESARKARELSGITVNYVKYWGYRKRLLIFSTGLLGLASSYPSFAAFTRIPGHLPTTFDSTWFIPPTELPQPTFRAQPPFPFIINQFRIGLSRAIARSNGSRRMGFNQMHHTFTIYLVSSRGWKR